MAETTKIHDRGPAPLGVPYPAKVTLPSSRSPVVRRQRLIDALTAALERRVVVVTAPAGYGKTTLLLDFARSSPLPVCWYSLDERDRDLETFLRYFVAAGQRQFAGFGAGLVRLLTEGGEPSPEAAVDLMVAAVEGAGQPLAFVLDNFQVLEDAPPALIKAIEGWIYRLPASCSVILSGRVQPRLGILPVMSVKQEIASIGARDLAFTCEEVVHLFREVLGKEISLDDAQHLSDITEGWAAALILLADRLRAAQTSVSLEQLRPTDTLYQYIALEVFDPLPEDLRRFLDESAVLRQMDVASVNGLLRISDAEERLDYLEGRNLFVCRDDAGLVYRYHNLFRAFLISHLRNRDPQRFVDLNLQAAAIREKSENWSEAVYHAVQAGAWEQVVRITDQVGWRLFEEGRWDTLADWLEAIPAAELARQPKLLLWKARILYYLNQADRALALLAQATASFEAKNDWLPLAEALITRGMCLRIKGDYAESREALAKARAILLERDGPTSVLTEARKELGITSSLAGKLTEAIQELTAVLDIYEAQGDMYNIAYTSDQLAATLVVAGRLSEAVTYLERARQRWTKLGNDQRLAATILSLANAYYLQGDYAKAEELVAQGLERAKAVEGRRPEVYFLHTLADIKRDQGDFASALEIYNSALDRAWSLDDAYVLIIIMDSIANTYRLMGDLVNGEAWAKRAMAEAEKHGGDMDIGICLMTRALLLRHEGELKEAVALLEKATVHLKEAGAGRELATAYFHLASTLFSLKRKRSALDYLELAAKATSELGYDHFLISEAAKNPLLIQYAAANKAADGYYARVLKAIKATSVSAVSGGSEAPAGEAATVVRAYGFGNPRVEVGGHEITDLEWRSNKSKEMFFFFLCNRRPLRKEEIVAALWPDLPEEKTTSAFHSNLHRLRKAIYPECIAKDSGRYVLDPRGHFSFDVEEFQEALQQAATLPKGSPEAIAIMEKALSIYTGPFAPDFYSEWAESLRWQLEEQYTSLLASLAAVYSEAGDFKRSADLCQRIIELDEYNEAAWYRLMNNYIRSGQMEAARYCYNRYAQILSRDGDPEDVPDFDSLCRDITSGRQRP